MEMTYVEDAKFHRGVSESLAVITNLDSLEQEEAEQMSKPLQTHQDRGPLTQPCIASRTPLHLVLWLASLLESHPASPSRRSRHRHTSAQR